MIARCSRLASLMLGASLSLASPGAVAQGAPTYADTVELAKRAGLVLRAQIVRMTRVNTANAAGAASPYQRYLVEAKTQALLYGTQGIGGSLRYIADVPTMQGAPGSVVAGQDVLLFAWRVDGKPTELRLVTPTAQQPWTPEAESRVRSVLTGLVARDTPSPTTSVRELLYVPGNLAGQGRTQMLLGTKDNGTASVTVRHEPGKAPVWSVSFSEVVGKASRPPAPDTLEWYSLACFLPRTLPSQTRVPGSDANRDQAILDYYMVLNALGDCPHNVT
ncbi:hypothetical protein A8V01_00815 [Novosphingobium guangzhouense]|uniref:Uncharacterized protein n=2 Tax=Novosphingobium guangzhouense TaxID=1850347 RepID=A0A2K2G6W1_9SPHN|nr:hypothetical protein A8V01_00815 [Novosphingobium guangzhouense]